MFRALDWLLDSIAPVLPKAQDAAELDEAWIPATVDGPNACETPLGMMLAKARRAAETPARD